MLWIDRLRRFRYLRRLGQAPNRVLFLALTRWRERQTRAVQKRTGVPISSRLDNLGMTIRFRDFEEPEVWGDSPTAEVQKVLAEEGRVRAGFAGAREGLRRESCTHSRQVTRADGHFCRSCGQRLSHARQ